MSLGAVDGAPPQQDMVRVRQRCRPKVLAGRNGYDSAINLEEGFNEENQEPLLGSCTETKRYVSTRVDTMRSTAERVAVSHDFAVR